MMRPIPTEYDKRDAWGTDAAGAVVMRSIEVREASDGLGAGYDAYQLTWMTLDDYGTVFQRGATKKSVSERVAEIPVLWQHDSGKPIGRHHAIREDKSGLLVQTVISDVTAGREAMTLLRDGVPLGHSFGFRRIKDRSATDDDQIDFSVAPDWAKSLPRNEIRVVTELAYWESSPVTFPANAKAKTQQVRSIFDDADSLPSLLASIRAGTLNDEETRQLEQIVAAWNGRAGAGPTTPLATDDEARRDRESVIRQIALRCGLTVEQLTCAV